MKNKSENDKRKNRTNDNLRLSYISVKTMIESVEGYKLLSTEYKNNRGKLEIHCPNNHIYHSTLDNFKKGNRCPECRNKRLNLKFKKSYDEVKSIIEQVEGYKLINKEYINAHGKMEFECSNGHLFLMSYHGFINKGNRCPHCRDRKGKNHPNWKGGISSLQEYLRKKINQWKLDSMNASNYKCVVTGDKFDDIHHLYSFHLILEEVLEELNLDIRCNISEYTNDELTKIEDKTIELHNRYPLGVCLRKDIHTLFHNIFGTSNNTTEQFEEFKTNYTINK